MYKIYVVIQAEDGELSEHELDGVLYPDKESAYRVQIDAITEDHIEDKFDIVGWNFKEV